ncbi:PH domain-containing protein [Aerolutibacter ruishenii]|uniref:YdbS-like PH domain-containing protein n=1 Tax=Aerolutibacter ruishenii TaxID=686800 RepID=A0A562M3J1_9GAMM|nr:PH domain-containing protein [Lysobacter ruishenii]TWI14440.1 hypothetical protein IP93_00438 [Lysobacter ruishenii]
MRGTHESTASTEGADPDWRPLPPRARGLMALNGALQLAIPGAVLGFVLGNVLASGLDLPMAWSGRVTGVVLPLLAAAGLGAWLGLRRHRHTHWRHDAQGLALRRGRLWWRETRVPATRVQHLDVTRGPLQRSRDLATLVVHTAGTQHSTLKLANLDAGDAERLRDALGRQIDHDDDA